MLKTPENTQNLSTQFCTDIMYRTHTSTISIFAEKIVLYVRLIKTFNIKFCLENVIFQGKKHFQLADFLKSDNRIFTLLTKEIHDLSSHSVRFHITIVLNHTGECTGLRQKHM